MPEVSQLTHEFVVSFPKLLEEGTVYVSVKFASSTHLCCCGCGMKVVTPISPAGWKLTFDGEAISLEPSIGNWSFPCKSHYWIINNRVRWAERWAADQIESAREADAAVREAAFAEKHLETAEKKRAKNAGKNKPKKRKSIFNRLRGWVKPR